MKVVLARLWKQYAEVTGLSFPDCSPHRDLRDLSSEV